jgi:hypothetical protein
VLAGCHPWFRIGNGAPADQEPVLISPTEEEHHSARAPGWEDFHERERAQRQEAWQQGRKHVRGTPSWVPLIDACMEAGESRSNCIDALPEEELAKLEAWESGHSRRRMRPPGSGTFGGQVQLVVPGNSFDWNIIPRLPREEAIALAYSSEYSQYRPGILSLVFLLWAEEDPPAAHQRLLLLANDFEVAGIEVQIIRRWLLSDASGAMFAAANSDQAETFELALRDYAHQDAVAALEVAQEYGNRMGPAEWTGVIAGVASNNPRLAAQRVASFGEDGAYLIDVFIGGLMVESPTEAIDWLLKHFPENTGHYESIASFFFIRDPAGAFSYLENMRDSAAKDALTAGLCQAKSTNEASRAISVLAQPPPGYAGSTCLK